MVLKDIELNGKKFQLHERLKQKLDNIKRVQQSGWDCTLLIDGIEGCGKSTLGLTCAYYLSDGKFQLKDICTGSNDAIDKLENAKDGGVLLIDEGSLLFSSSDAMRKEQKQLILILNVIRQKKMALIIVSPSFFRLNRYIATDRSRFLIHVYTKNDLKRGRFIYFSQKKKNKLYELGKKNYNSYAKPKSSWNGAFVDFNPFGKKYHDIKKKSLQEALHPENKKDYKPASIARITTSALVKKIYAKLPIESPNELARAMEITKKMLDYHNTVEDDIDFNGKANKVYKSDLRRKREDENAAKDKENNKKYKKSNEKDVQRHDGPKK